MRVLFTTTALSGAALFAAVSAQAQTVISTAVTNPVATSGQDLKISSTGSVKPTSGTAVTMNSNNSVENDGDIAIRGASDAIGILANPNTNGTITNSGSIVIDEDYTQKDDDNDGDLDGLFALGNNRFGIRVSGPHTGNVINSGDILVEGNQSAGIALDGPLTGSLNSSGKVEVLGNDSVGIRTGSVSGNIAITSGSISVQGANAVGLMVGGDVGGALTLQGAITSTGYRYPQAPTDPSKLDADDLLQGGSAVVVGGNVAGGILLDVRPANTDEDDTDEDNDGIADAQEGNGSLTSYGAAPALAIGSATRDIAIGEVGSTGYGLVLKGNVSGIGVYDGVSATAISIGSPGHAVDIAGGASISGAVAANAVKADATAVHVRSGATVPTVEVDGLVRASTSGSDTATAQAILIGAGADVTSIRNKGIIEAVAGDGGTFAAIVDRSGSVRQIVNKGSISAGTAIDVSANTTGVTIRQSAGATGKPAPSITGSILLGSGNDFLDIRTGKINGTIDFGGGSDRFNLGGNYSGHLLNSGGTAVTLGAGSVLGVTNTGTVNLNSLTSNGGAIGVVIGDNSNTLYNVAGTASFGAGSSVVVNLQKVGSAAGSYTIVDAGTLVGGSNLGTSIDLPFLFNSSLTSSEANGTVTLDIDRKSAAELGLNASEATAIDAILAAADNDQPIASVFLGVEDSEKLKANLQQLLPEHAGGTFETATRGIRLATRFLADPNLQLADMGRFSVWLQQVGWARTKSIGSTSGYKLSGWGVSGGAELAVGKLGSAGLSLAYHAGRDNRGENDLGSNEFEAGAYWRGGTGPLRGYVRGGVGRVSFDQTRRFVATVDGDVITREADGDWKGTVYSAGAGVTYDARFGRMSARPLLALDHYKLTEKGFAESGGGEAFDLIVDGRSSHETSATATLSLGYELLSLDHRETWMRIELEAGRREIISGELGPTTVRFADGTPFTLVAEKRTSGWLAGLRAIGGSSAMTAAAELNTEQQQGDSALGGRFSIQLPF
ncbi:autotransporter domain-containing protein [Sphingomonas sabuli]|uniref:Autotransporter domain-containing protein n=1 Tax=Sphingomonas sabuli TaxID=2764186 RepID=A0A7G9L144_9SPHN|nr:autotransporter outer membrane beta-barrel domain-containing protein [Sphingomonas sabuli]QNM82343.1 autotransporter domain-containing protein [Sphingomonas sabuli]